MATRKYRGFYIFELGDSGFFAYARKMDIGKKSIAGAGSEFNLKLKIDRLLEKRVKRKIKRRKK